MHQLIPDKLWIGNVGDATEYRKLELNGIGAVVELAIDEPATLQPRERISLRIPLMDSGSTEDARVELAVRIIVDLMFKRIRTLVVCSNGMNRSVCVGVAVASVVLQDDPDTIMLRLAEKLPKDLSPSIWSSASHAARKLMA
jgi:hypothetical protein